MLLLAIFPSVFWTYEKWKASFTTSENLGLFFFSTRNIMGTPNDWPLPLFFFFFVNDFRVHKSRQWNYCKFVFNTCLELRQSFEKKKSYRFVCLTEAFFLKKKVLFRRLNCFLFILTFFSVINKGRGCQWTRARCIASTTSL